MGSNVSKLVALLAAVLLALPPGWCTLAVGGDARGTTESVAPRPACCAHAAVGRSHCPLSASSESPQPAKVVRCCCVRDALLPESSVSPDDSSSTAIFMHHVPPVVVNAATVFHGGSFDQTNPFWEGPRLHILKCVWRC